MAQIDGEWQDPTNGNKKGDLVFRTVEPGGASTLPERMRITHEGRVLVGRDTTISSNEYFGVTAPAGADIFGGMYMETTDPNSKPFYGYARDGLARAWHYYDSPSDSWRLNVGADRMTVERNTGNVGIGETAPDARLHVSGGNLYVSPEFSRPSAVA